jgi:hypothetical protein
MDEKQKALQIIISGTTQGKPFQDLAQLEPFGSFGALIYSSQIFATNDLFLICDDNGQPVASAEVIWVRTGLNPAVEVLLHRNVDLVALGAKSHSLGEGLPRATGPLLEPLAAAPKRPSGAEFTLPPPSTFKTTEIIPTLTCISCNKPNNLASSSCKYCGAYLEASTLANPGKLPSNAAIVTSPNEFKSNQLNSEDLATSNKLIPSNELSLSSSPTATINTPSSDTLTPPPKSLSKSSKGDLAPVSSDQLPPSANLGSSGKLAKTDQPSLDLSTASPVYCPHCGKLNSLEDSSCKTCGGYLGDKKSSGNLPRKKPSNSDIKPLSTGSLKTVEMAATLLCTNCSKPNSAEDSYCKHCGSYLTTSSTARRPRKRPTGDNLPSLKSDNLKTTEITPVTLCSSCGKSNSREDSYCRFCGSHLDTSKGDTPARKRTSPIKTPNSNVTGNLQTTELDAMMLCNSCNKPNSTESSSCRHCGAYLGQTGSFAAAKPGKNNTALLGSPPTPDKVSKTAPLRQTSSMFLPELPDDIAGPPRTTTRLRTIRPAVVAELNALQKRRNYALLVLLVTALLFGATFIPRGVNEIAKTPIEAIQQTGCLNAANITPTTNATSTSGELDIWTKSLDSKIEFIRKDLTLTQAITYLNDLRQGGTQVRGSWCPKFNSKPLNNSNLEVSAVLTLPWTLKPTSAIANSLQIQYVDKTLTVQEDSSNGKVDRSEDLQRFIYYPDTQKITLQFKPSSNKLLLEELDFYLPSPQDPAAAATGKLGSATRVYYLANTEGLPLTTESTDYLFIIQIILGILTAAGSIYVGLNYYQTSLLKPKN